MKEFVYVVKGTIRHFDGQKDQTIVSVHKVETHANCAGYDWARYQNERMHLENLKSHASYEVFRFPLE